MVAIWASTATRQTARCRAPASLDEHLLSEPLPPRLMLTTSIVSRCLYTQSSPQITDDHVPLPSLLKTLTAQSRAPGATPTTPARLSLAAMVPATDRKSTRLNSSHA